MRAWNSFDLALRHRRACAALVAQSSILRGEQTEPDANSVLVGLALYDPDRVFVEI
jgi:hypothetical protein